MDVYLPGSSSLNKILYLDNYSVLSTVPGPGTWDEQDRCGLWIVVLMSDGGSQQEIRPTQMEAIMKKIKKWGRARK